MQEPSCTEEFLAPSLEVLRSKKEHHPAAAPAALNGELQSQQGGPWAPLGRAWLGLAGKQANPSTKSHLALLFGFTQALSWLSGHYLLLAFSALWLSQAPPSARLRPSGCLWLGALACWSRAEPFGATHSALAMACCSKPFFARSSFASPAHSQGTLRQAQPPLPLQRGAPGGPQARSLGQGLLAADFTSSAMM